MIYFNYYTYKDLMREHFEVMGWELVCIRLFITATDICENNLREKRLILARGSEGPVYRQLAPLFLDLW
jgi:hypothetical protein